MRSIYMDNRWGILQQEKEKGTASTYVFEKDGILASHIDGYSERTQQLEMALAIGEAIENNTQLVADLKNGVITPEEAAVSYDYTAPLVMLACLGIAALVLGFILKIVDKKKGLGLEEPNIKA